jgi:hypothetical protein
MPSRNITLTNKIALHEIIKNQMPNTSHCHLGQIIGVLKPTPARYTAARETVTSMGIMPRTTANFPKTEA